MRRAGKAGRARRRRRAWGRGRGVSGREANVRQTGERKGSVIDGRLRPGNGGRIRDGDGAEEKCAAAVRKTRKRGRKHRRGRTGKPKAHGYGARPEQTGERTQCEQWKQEEQRGLLCGRGPGGAHCNHAGYMPH